MQLTLDNRIVEECSSAQLLEVYLVSSDSLRPVFVNDIMMKRAGSCHFLNMDHVDQILVACLTEVTKSLDPARFGGLESR